jgi:putative DNA primase/helicase
VADVELNRQEKINIFKSLFKGRSDCYGAETSCIKESLTDSVITEHLLGQKRIGVYMMLTDSTYFACIDIDRKDNEPLAIEDSKEILNVSQSYGLHGCIERSKRKGFHIWYFFSDLVQASKIRALLKQIQSDSRIEKIEINPKQDHVNIDDDEYGNFVNLPLFKTDLATGRTAFLDLNFQPYSDQWQFLSDIKTITPKEIDDIIELNTISIIPEPEQKNTPKTTGIKGDLGKVVNGCVFIKHCIDEAGSLPEPLWYAMICNLVSLPGGHEKIHEFSEPYKSYTYNETQAKIEHAINDSPGPTTCKQIKELGFTCDNKTCNVKAPAGKAYKQTIDKSSKAGDPVTEKEAETKKANAELKTIIGKHDLNTDEGKQLAEIEAKAYIDQFTNTNISRKLIATLNDSIGDSKYKKAKYNYTDDTGRIVFSHGKLADELMSEYTFICVDGVLYVYQKGVYNAIGDTFVESVCQKKLDWSARNTRINEVISYIKRCVGVENKALNTHKYLINLENGMYDLTNEKLLAHSTEYLSTTRIPVNYDQNADNSFITAWLASILVDSDCIQLVCELFGYCMIPDTTMKKAFMLVGVSNTGKSTFSRVLENFVGNENVSKIPLQEISDSRFKRAELFGKLVNIFADLDKKPLRSTSYFKTIVSGDSIDAERKCQNPFFFKPFARLVFSANEIPISDDKSTAYFNRWNIINFDQVFTGANDKKGYADELSKPENLSALLNCAIFGLKSVLKRQSFTVTEKGKKALDDYMKQNDPTGAFLETCCELDVNSRINRSDLFVEYDRYCEESEFTAETNKAFYGRIRRIAGVKEIDGKNENQKSVRFFTGIKLIAD